MFLYKVNLIFDYILYLFYDEVKINKYECVFYKLCIDCGCFEVYIIYFLMQLLIEFNDCSIDVVYLNVLFFFFRIMYFKLGYLMIEVGDILVFI